MARLPTFYGNTIKFEIFKYKKREKKISVKPQTECVLLCKRCVLCVSDECSAVFRWMCSAGGQFPAGHHHYLSAQWSLWAEDLHAGWIHADGCRLVTGLLSDLWSAVKHQHLQGTTLSIITWLILVSTTPNLNFRRDCLSHTVHRAFWISVLDC